MFREVFHLQDKILDLIIMFKPICQESMEFEHQCKVAIERELLLS